VEFLQRPHLQGFGSLCSMAPSTLEYI
jgi:hypothetical protein